MLEVGAGPLDWWFQHPRDLEHGINVRQEEAWPWGIHRLRMLPQGKQQNEGHLRPSKAGHSGSGSRSLRSLRELDQGCSGDSRFLDSRLTVKASIAE